MSAYDLTFTMTISGKFRPRSRKQENVQAEIEALAADLRSLIEGDWTGTTWDYKGFASHSSEVIYDARPLA